MSATVETEKVGDKFDFNELVLVREKTWRSLRAIAGMIRPGQSEAEANELAKMVLNERGVDRHWHRPNIRFGRNTIKTFRDPSEPNTLLNAEDIFFIDIGPVWHGYEGDAGCTFVVGNNPDHLRCERDVKEVFNLTYSRWKQGAVSGHDLYEYAEARAGDLGWQLVRDMSGHRLSDFPHSAYHKGSLGEFDGQPKPYAWVLEIQIRHPELPFGAFYEDLLF